LEQPVSDVPQGQNLRDYAVGIQCYLH